MGTPVDRRVATGFLALVVGVFAVILSSASTPEVNHQRALKSLVQLLVQGGRTESRVVYSVRREPTIGNQVGSGRELVLTAWLRDKPYLHLELSEDSLHIATAKLGVNCFGSSIGIQCVRDGVVPERDDGSATLFAEIQIWKRYEIVAQYQRRIADQNGECFRIRLRPGATMMISLGTRLDLCLNHDGIVLFSLIVRPDSLDTRTAVRVKRGVTTTEIADVLRKHADPSLRSL